MPPAPSSACLKRQLGPQWQNPSLKKTAHRCAELLPAPSALLPAKTGLLVVAVVACAAAAATAGPCLLEAPRAGPGLEKLRLPALLPQAAALVALAAETALKTCYHYCRGSHYCRRKLSPS